MQRPDGSSSSSLPSSRPPNTMNTRAPTNLHRPATPTLEDSVPDDELKITSKATTTNSSSHASISSQGSVSSRDDWSRDSTSMNGLVAKKKKVQDRPWKPARQYDAVLTDSVDVCGVNANVISPTKTCAASGEIPNREKKMDDDNNDDDDDDVSYDEGEDSDVDPTLSSRWSKQQPSSMEEVKQAHLKGIGLAAASRKEGISSVGQKNHDLGELPLTPVSKDKELKRKNHEQVRLEALKLLELANSTGESGQYIIKETYSSGTTSGSSKFKSMRVKGLERNSALSGMSGLSSALKERRQRGTYDRMDMDMDMDGSANDDGKGDVFMTNPVNSPIKGRLDDVRINDDVLDDDEELGPSGMEGRKTWGSRYSIDRHLSAVYGGLTSKQVLSKMDRDHYNDLNKNTSANNMFKTSPHEDENDRWNVSNGKKAQKHKNRLWNTWIANVKDTFTYIVTKYESSSTAQWRSADHSSAKKGIFTGVAITNFLDRLSPRSRSDAVARGYGDSGSSFNWRNINLADNSRDLPDVNFSANDDISFEKRQKRKRMFWLAVLLLSLVTLFTVVGTAVSNANAGKKGGGYISVGEEVKFFVTSDIPLNRADETKLSRELSNLHARDGDFLIHLGDINSASTSLCTFSVYDDAAALLKQSPIPVLVLPGNNDWNECPMPEAAFEYWEEKFGRFENNFDVEQLPNFPSVNRQMGRDENFAFLHKGVLFIGVHVVDGTVQSEREWSIRDTENLQWVEQQLNLYDANEFRAIVLLGHAGYSSKVGDFFWPAAEKFKLANKPVLYLHANDGDGMIEYHPVSDFKKFTAVRVEKGSKVASTQIVVGGGMKPFSYVVRAED